ncbi:MAG: protein-L-isoaspartate(D-aspartate) O-methyltransferase [Rhodospirillales bacterium]|nr:protein-L-isoaspartate(D-aspartate) O-methyltransferase [Rhodospirillales bacterium]
MDLAELEQLDRSAAIGAAARDLPPLSDAPAFGAAFDALGAYDVVLLGEATHGTQEFYVARAAITRRLVEQHGFTILALEADWPDAAALGRWIDARRATYAGLRPFERFPTWMWRNQPIQALTTRLRAVNAARTRPDQRVGIYGLDLYSLGASTEAVLAYLDRHDPEAAAEARRHYGCIRPWLRDPGDYGWSVETGARKGCEEAVLAVLRDLLEKRIEAMREDSAAWLDAFANAKLVVDAEAYYRAAVRSSDRSWNLRDTHMMEVLQLVLSHRPGAKAIVWAHNSHLGDARATELGWSGGELNLGQLCRERFGGRVVSVGFATDRGTVRAANAWDEPGIVMRVNRALPGSVEALCAAASAGPGGREIFALDLAAQGAAAQALELKLLERAIGVIYRPSTERRSHYFEALVPRQFDHLVWFAETSAVVTDAPAGKPAGVEAETWPFGL